MKKFNKSATVLITLALLCGYSFLPQLDAQESAKCIAVITGINGNVLLKRAGSNDFTKSEWGNQLFKGDQIKIENNSLAIVTFINGTIITLDPGSIMTVNDENLTGSATAGSVKKVTAGLMTNMSALTGKRETKKDISALAGLRSALNEEPIELLSPFTLIKTSRPTFVWMPDKPYDAFVVNLYSSKGLVWSTKVSQSSLEFPQKEKGLEPGETYFWNVEGEDLLDNKKSASFRFSVLSQEKSKEVNDQETLIRKTFENEKDSSSLHSFLGAYYMNQGMLEDAIREFEIISEMNPGASLPHEILGSLYSDVGEKDKAISELQKALTLSKGKKE